MVALPQFMLLKPHTYNDIPLTNRLKMVDDEVTKIAGLIYRSPLQALPLLVFTSPFFF